MEQKRKITYERYIFRIMAQDDNESIEKYYERLRKQSKHCKFSCCEESQITDQIIEKCKINEIRSRAFEGDISLNEILQLGKVIETARKNMKSSFDFNNVVSQKAKIEDNMKHRKTPTEQESPKCVKNGMKVMPKIQEKQKTSQIDENKMCSRCGSCDHMFYDMSCPAKKNRCAYCHCYGHYERLCRKMKSPESREKGIAKKPRRDESLGFYYVSVNEVDMISTNNSCENQHKQITTFPTTTELAIKNTKQEFPDCISGSVKRCRIGNIVTTIEVNYNNSCNAMSIKTFNMLRENKADILHHDRDPVVFQDHSKEFIGQWIGQCIAQVDVEGKKGNVKFYLYYDDRIFIALCLETAKFFFPCYQTTCE